MKMQQMLRAMGQKDIPALKPTLEINPDHEIIRKLLARSSDETADDAACPGRSPSLSFAVWREPRAWRRAARPLS